MFLEEEFQEHVQLMDRQQLVTVMVDLLGGRFLSGVSTNPGRVQAVLEVLAEIDEQGKNEVQGNKENPSEQEGDTDDEDDEKEEEIATPTGASPCNDARTTKVSTRQKSPRKAKSIAKRKITEDANGTSELLQQFAGRAGDINRLAAKKDKVKPQKVDKLRSKEKSSVRPSLAVNSDPDSSDSDPSSSESDIDVSSSSSSSASSSSSDSDNGIVSDRVRRRSRTHRHRNSIRHRQRREGYKLAKQVWEMCNGKVHYYLSRHQWTSKRTEYEIDTITRVFDYRMASGANLWDKDIRLLASRILVLQSQDLTGSWETAAQFQANPMGYVVVSKKQLSRAAKNAEQLMKVVPKQKMNGKAFDQPVASGGAGNNNQVNNQRGRWRNDRPNQVPAQNNYNQFNNRAAGNAGSSNNQ